MERILRIVRVLFEEITFKLRLTEVKNLSTQTARRKTVFQTEKMASSKALRLGIFPFLALVTE
jgi:hypothetical protein